MQTRAEQIEGVSFGAVPGAPTNSIAWRPWQRGILYAGFAASGMGCALTGSLLPVLLLAWHWTDRQAGALFLLITLSSASAPLLLRGTLRPWIVAGFAAITAGALAWSLPTPLHLCGGAALGIGLGTVMTSISLTLPYGRTDATRVFARLNIAWAAGALVCPLLVSRALRRGSATAVLFAVAAGSGTLGLLAWRTPLLQTSSPRTLRLSVRGIAPSMLVCAALATSAEAACGSWLTVYVQRSQHSVSGAVFATTFFWLGLLLSRCIQSFARLGVSTNTRIAALATLSLLAAVALTRPQLVPLQLAAFGIGLGLGPLYPEMLARVLRIRENSTVFFFAGAASATSSWLVGVISTRTHSVTRGLLVLVTVCALLLLAALRLGADEPTPADLASSSA